jgi:hypothetical protein
MLQVGGAKTPKKNKKNPQFDIAENGSREVVLQLKVFSSYCWFG